MTTLKINTFTGEMPHVLTRLLPGNYASEAFNTRLLDGSLKSIRADEFQYTLDAPVTAYQTLYKNGAEWLAWEKDVYAVPAPIDEDRLYIFGDGVPKMRVASTNYGLAVTRPTVALTATVAGTPTNPGTDVTRLYMYTNVTQFGEESEPCPISNEAVWAPGQTVTLTGFDTTMTNNRTASTQRIYRSQTGQTGTELYFIVERSASNSSFTDTVAVDDISYLLPSINYNAPPDDLTGVISAPNGMLVGFKGKQILFCEPYLPHAWPQEYILTVDYPVVGLGAFGNAIVVTTEGYPYVLSGTTPTNMVSEKLERNLPCINARGIQDMGYGVAYPSYDGLVLVQQGSATIVTNNLFSRYQWNKLIPGAMVSGQNDGRYYAAYDYTDFDGKEYSGSIVLDILTQSPFVMRTDKKPDAYYYNIADGQLYYALDDEVYLHDAPGREMALQYWRSKDFVFPRPTNFGAILVESDDALTPEEIHNLELHQQAVIAANQAKIDNGEVNGSINAMPLNVFDVNGGQLDPVPQINNEFVVTVYADDEIVANVTKWNVMERLPAGFKARKWSVAVYGTLNVAQVTLASTARELMGV